MPQKELLVKGFDTVNGVAKYDYNSLANKPESTGSVTVEKTSGDPVVNANIIPEGKLKDEKNNVFFPITSYDQIVIDKETGQRWDGKVGGGGSGSGSVNSIDGIEPNNLGDVKLHHVSVDLDSNAETVGDTLDVNADKLGGKLPEHYYPNGGNAGDALTKTADGSEWKKVGDVSFDPDENVQMQAIPIDADTLGGKPANKYFSDTNIPTAEQVGALPKNGKAVDSDKLGGKEPNFYALAQNVQQENNFRPEWANMEIVQNVWDFRICRIGKLVNAYISLTFKDMQLVPGMVVATFPSAYRTSSWGLDLYGIYGISEIRPFKFDSSTGELKVDFTENISKNAIKINFTYGAKGGFV